MSTNCSSPFDYFDSPEFLKLSLHLISIFSTPIFILGTYCILFETPDQMKLVKWYMLAFHLIIVVFNYSISVLVVPYLLTPEIAAVMYGNFKLIGLPISLAAMMPLHSLSYILVTIVCLHENRFFILCEFGFREKWRFWRRVWCAAFYIIALAFQIPIYFLVPDQETAKSILIKNLPCLPESIYNEPTIFVLATDYSYHMCFVISFLINHFSGIGFFMLQILWRSNKKLRIMSSKTLEMYKQFFKGLAIQMLVPVIIIMIPLAFVGLAILMRYHNQAALNFSVIGITTYGPIFTIVMVLVHKPYRSAIRRLIRGKDIKVASTVASVV